MAYDLFDMLFIKIDTMQFPKLQLFRTCEMFALQRMEVHCSLFTQIPELLNKFKSNVARYLLFTCLSRNRNWEVHPVT